MTTLPAFLLARLAEDEAAARAATGEQWGRLVDGAPQFRRVVTWGLTPIGAMNAEGDADHIARQHPARVLADVAAKRAIVDLHFVGDPQDWDVTQWACRLCQWDEDCDSPKHDHHYGAGVWPCPTLRHLASVYASHPEFDEAWAL